MPVIIITETGTSTAVVSSLVNTQFQYQDVGVNIEITPTVHFDHDITLKIKIEVTAQSGSVTISGVTEPILSQRVAEQTIRLREGEANILGGINEKQIQDSWSGIPGLSSIPILRYVFGSKDGAQARLVAVLDNLGKGASGAAVQNLNLMAGLPETAGLRL